MLTERGGHEVKAVLAGGGTGGHIYPALAIATAWRRLVPGVELLFVGARGRMEENILTRLGEDFVGIPARPLPRYLISPEIALTGVATALGIWHGVRVIRSFRPDVVIGTGGYASSCSLAAACMFSIPMILFEANAVAGRANRLLGRWANVVAAGFEDALGQFPNGKAQFTGVPVREAFFSRDREAARAVLGVRLDAVVLLVFGGSQGARWVNEAILEVAPALLLRYPQLTIIHLCGQALFGEARKVRDGWGDFAERYLLHPYADNMPQLLAAADLAFCRAGSSSIAELLAAGVPSILVPYPHAAGDHQRVNALNVESCGAALVIEEGESNTGSVFKVVGRLLDDPTYINKMRKAAHGASVPDAAEKIVEMAMKACHLAKINHAM